MKLIIPLLIIPDDDYMYITEKNAKVVRISFVDLTYASSDVHRNI